MTGRRVFSYFVAFFGFIVAVNAVMITLALRTHSGMVTDHPYEKGLAYNRVVEAEQEQAALGWKSTLNYEGGMLHFELRDRENNLIVPDKLTANFTRPSRQGMDFSVEMKAADAIVDFPVRGLWEVRVVAVHQGVHYQKSRRIIVE